MSANSKIEWTDATWNPIRGTKGRHFCTKISPGCAHCYAERLNLRFSGIGYTVGADVQRLDGAVLLEPLRWRKPRKVFVCSMTDLFHEDVCAEWLDRIYAVMALCPQHTFIVLTKRAQRMRAYLAHWSGNNVAGRIADIIIAMRHERGDHRPVDPLPHLDPGAVWYPLANVWHLVSAEDQKYADERIPELLATPSAVRGVSLEPLLGPIDLGTWLYDGYQDCEHAPGCKWVIVGGESGPGARPMDVQWARNIVGQCKAAGIPVFVKQLGSEPGFKLEDEERRGNFCPGFHHGKDDLSIKKLKDRKGGDPAEWPADLRVRQFPEARA